MEVNGGEWRLIGVNGGAAFSFERVAVVPQALPPAVSIPPHPLSIVGVVLRRVREAVLLLFRQASLVISIVL